ncbi:MAG TPA: hypothetical protein VKX39_01680 [Bryobacteraceae bacterium]|nr:hypothetical protein [Bryobacteraceae bacterium]
MTETYADLLAETAPAVIENDEQFTRINGELGRLVGRGRRRTPEETKLMRLLAVLVEDYERRNALPPEEATAADRLQFLLQHSGKTPADLLPIFGQRSHVNEALNGRRPISAPQARKLGALFHVNPGLFL